MKQQGNALITLIIFVAVGITVTTSAVVVSIINTQGLSKMAQSEVSLMSAEGGAENAILRLLRNPEYTGESLNIGLGTDTINVTGTTDKVIVSEGNYNSFTRKVRVNGTFVSNQLNITDWLEIE